jgi:hypothetical protein
MEFIKEPLSFVVVAVKVNAFAKTVPLELGLLTVINLTFWVHHHADGRAFSLLELTLENCH